MHSSTFAILSHSYYSVELTSSISSSSSLLLASSPFISSSFLLTLAAAFSYAFKFLSFFWSVRLSAVARAVGVSSGTRQSFIVTIWKSCWAHADTKRDDCTTAVMDAALDTYFNLMLSFHGRPTGVRAWCASWASYSTGRPSHSQPRCIRTAGAPSTSIILNLKR